MFPFDKDQYHIAGTGPDLLRGRKIIRRTARRKMPGRPITEQGPLSEPLRGKPARNMEPEVGQEDRPF